MRMLGLKQSIDSYIFKSSHAISFSLEFLIQNLKKNIFFQLLQEVKEKKPSIHVIYQNIILPNPPRDVLMLDIYADRAKYLAMKPKILRMKRDMRYCWSWTCQIKQIIIKNYIFSVFMTKLKNLENSYMHKDDFLNLLKSFKAKLDVMLIDQYIQECTVNIDGKPLTNVHLMANHYLNRHPRAFKKADSSTQAIK